MISGLFTSHGPWEGWDTSKNKIIPYQTTVHTLSLILGESDQPRKTCIDISNTETFRML